MEEFKADRRQAKRDRKRYGHAGPGASHTRTSSEAEVISHIRKIKKGKK
jgi:hypothetical protein|tara:strand:- start:852 stop:998 length:147 start_codon:yes stop_codon:yes gene_type:complete